MEPAKELHTDYVFSTIEHKWQKHWDDQGYFKAQEDPDAKPFYALAMFPYPSGALHVGHVRNYTLIDVVARFQRAKGHHVLNPIGWDAFGLPAENAAIKTGIHPKISTLKHIDRMRQQFQQLGYAFDWSREILTCHENYYRWTQWLFIQMLKLKGSSGEPLVYRKRSKIHWCPHDKTVLANEQVVKCTQDGETYNGCFRCSTKVEQKELEQWCFRITDYAEELLNDLDDLKDKWPESVLSQQQEWIGKSQGTQIIFKIQLGDQEEELPVFTTRADTLFGVSFLSLAPEHPLIDTIIKHSPTPEKLQAFVDELCDLEPDQRMASGEKQGFDTGLYAIHPLTQEQIPLFVANYVLMYGTGAVMAVPAHDQRDFEFAQKYQLPIKAVIQPGHNADAESLQAYQALENTQAAFEMKGRTHNSGSFDGLSSAEAVEKITAALQTSGLGKATTNYKIRDWGVSRQRYWGCPIPVIHCPQCGIVPVPEHDLPVLLPEDVEFMPTGRSPLEDHPDFSEVECPRCKYKKAKRDTDTLDTFVDSSWYYLRYTDPQNQDKIACPDKSNYWLNVDQYIGGSEHAILHLIYARFIWKVMRDLGIVQGKEPFKRLFTQGMILKEAIRVRSENLRYIGVDEFEEGRKQGKFPEKDLVRIVKKMSKSQLNVVDPEYIVERYGADTLRAYIAFIGPSDSDALWDDGAVLGVHKFLRRWWDLQALWQPRINLECVLSETSGEQTPKEKELQRITQLLIQKCEKEYSTDMGLNTCISKAMEVVNFLREHTQSFEQNPESYRTLRKTFETLALCLAPITPHICEELWFKLGHKKSIAESPWPQFKPELITQKEKTIGIQINGKLRDSLTLSLDLSQDEALEIALKQEKVTRYTEGKKIRKVIYIPGKILNIVVA